MKRLLLRCLLLVVVSALLTVPLSGVFAQIQVPIPQLATPIMVVNTPLLNARSGPGSQFTVLATLPGGIELPVLASTPDQEWYLVTTPFGNAWIDVDFVLARGDFSFVPVINPIAPAPQVVLPTALTLQLPTSRLFGARSPVAVAGTSTRRAALQVLSVDLRRGAFEESGVITTLYLDPNIDFVVLGTQFDRRGVEWVAIQVPGVGTGWIERAKTRIYDRLITPTEALQQQPADVTAPTNNLLPFPMQTLATPIAIVNTPFLNIRTGPGGQFSVLWVASGGTTYDVIGVTPDVLWVLVEGEPFGAGWVNAPFVLLRGNLSNVPVIAY